MSLLRRRRPQRAALPTPTLPPQSLTSGGTPTPNTPVHVERALITLTTKMQQCVERLDALEHRLDELAESTMNSPSHSDVLEVRIHSAKLAAELARTTVEFRGALEQASNEARRFTAAAIATAAAQEPIPAPIAPAVSTAGAATQPAIDLTTGMQAADDDNAGWSATA